MTRSPLSICDERRGVGLAAWLAGLVLSVAFASKATGAPAYATVDMTPQELPDGWVLNLFKVRDGQAVGIMHTPSMASGIDEFGNIGTHCRPPPSGNS